MGETSVHEMGDQAGKPQRMEWAANKVSSLAGLQLLQRQPWQRLEHLASLQRRLVGAQGQLAQRGGCCQRRRHLGEAVIRQVQSCQPCRTDETTTQ